MSEIDGFLERNSAGMACEVCGRDIGLEIPVSDPELMQAGHQNYLHMRCWIGANAYQEALKAARC